MTTLLYHLRSLFVIVYMAIVAGFWALYDLLMNRLYAIAGKEWSGI